MESRRDIFQAIADPTRRAIIILLATQALTPKAIAEDFQTSRQAVSKHLQILVECQLVKQEQRGREIYYSLEMEKMKEVDKWISQFRKIWETQFNQLLLQYLALYRKGQLGKIAAGQSGFFGFALSAVRLHQIISPAPKAHGGGVHKLGFRTDDVHQP